MWWELIMRTADELFLTQITSILPTRANVEPCTYGGTMQCAFINCQLERVTAYIQHLSTYHISFLETHDTDYYQERPSG